MALVPDDRPAQLPAHLLVGIRQYLVRHEIWRVQLVAAKKSISAAARDIGARLRDRLDLHTGGPTLRDVEQVGDDLELRDGLAAEARLAEPGAGDLLRDLLAIEIQLPQVVHRAGADAVADVVGGHALHELRQLHPVAALERKLLHLPPIDVSRDLRRCDVDERRLTGDGHRLADLRQLEHERHGRVLPDEQLDFGDHNARESRQLCLHPVFSWLQLQPKLAAFVGDRIGLCAGLEIDRGDDRCGQRRPRLIADGSDERCFLSGRARAEECEQCDDAGPEHSSSQHEILPRSRAHRMTRFFRWYEPARTETRAAHNFDAKRGNKSARDDERARPQRAALVGFAAAPAIKWLTSYARPFATTCLT